MIGLADAYILFAESRCSHLTGGEDLHAARAEVESVGVGVGLLEHMDREEVARELPVLE